MFGCLIFIGIALTSCLGQQIDPRTYDISIVSAKTFDQNIAKFLNEKAAAVLYYNSNKKDGVKHVNGFYGEVAKALRGQVTVAACDCFEWPDFCAKQGAADTPRIIVYPTNPIPHYKYEGKETKDALIGQLSRLIPAKNVLMLESSKLTGFLDKDAGVPKVILISDKPKPSSMYNALANSFADRMNFAFSSSTEDKITNKYKVTKFPTLVLHKGGNKPEVYTGKMNFPDLHEWINVRSETFVKGGGFSEATSIESSKPWLAEKFPEMHRNSHQDVCFKHRVLCVILLTDSDVSEENSELLESLSNRFSSSSSDRGPKFRWMWMNVAEEPNWKELFNVDTLPSVAAFFSGKRPRFTVLESGKEATFDSSKDFLDKILGGDAKFQIVKKNPTFSGSRRIGKKDEL
eukprot:GHVO01016292.1.p1 GENE.GHVO01016292.1~~GHVO01016292.1.p1  ORF type:complete len:403 (+),score=55.67 GHVO01016292.1:287-1495(+)